MSFASALASFPDLEGSIESFDDLTDEDLRDWLAMIPTNRLGAPFFTPEWLDAWIKAFSPDAPFLVTVREREKLVGIACMARETESWIGYKLRTARSATNVWSSRFEFLALADRSDIYFKLWSTLLQESDCDSIRLDHLPADSPTLMCAVQVAKELDCPYVSRSTYSSLWTDLPAHLSSKFKSNLRNRERRLVASGDVHFSVGQSNRGLEDSLQIFYEVEASGWKGKEGTAVAQNDRAKKLYDFLIRRMQGRVWIPVLYSGVKPLAAQVILVWDRAMYLLKTSYDPEYARFAPSQLLTARAFQFGVEQGMRTFDFLGTFATWKTNWARQTRPHVELVVCYPKSLYRSAFSLCSGLRNHAKKIPGLGPAVRWVHRKVM
jgi:CelD/BcsL family acetyltransferase involved in cellulose biosynthesis